MDEQEGAAVEPQSIFGKPLERKPEGRRRGRGGVVEVEEDVLPEALEQMVMAMAARRGVSRSEVVREAVRLGLRKMLNPLG